MTDTGPNYPATIAQAATASIDWADITNLGSDNNAYATVNLGTGSGIAEKITVTGFGFAIPDANTIAGVTVVLGAFVGAGSGDVVLNSMKLVVGGSEAGTPTSSQSAVTSTTEVTRTIGGAADMWSTALTPAQVNAADFGFVFAARDNDIADTLSVDYVSMTITHSAPAVAPGLSRGKKLALLLGVG